MIKAASEDVVSKAGRVQSPKHTKEEKSMLETNHGGQKNTLQMFRDEIFIFFFFFFFGVWSHPRYIEVPRLGIESELKLLAYAIATAMPDLSHISNLHPSSWKQWILTHWAGSGIKPTSSWILATHTIRDTSQVWYCWDSMGTPIFFN